MKYNLVSGSKGDFISNQPNEDSSYSSFLVRIIEPYSRDGLQRAWENFYHGDFQRNLEKLPIDSMKVFLTVKEKQILDFVKSLESDDLVDSLNQYNNPILGGYGLSIFHIPISVVQRNLLNNQNTTLENILNKISQTNNVPFGLLGGVLGLNSDYSLPQELSFSKFKEVNLDNLQIENTDLSQFNEQALDLMPQENLKSLYEALTKIPNLRETIQIDDYAYTNSEAISYLEQVFALRGEGFNLDMLEPNNVPKSHNFDLDNWKPSGRSN